MGAIVIIGVALLAGAGGLRILVFVRHDVDPMFPERGPAPRLLAGVLAVTVSVFLVTAMVISLLQRCRT